MTKRIERKRTYVVRAGFPEARHAVQSTYKSASAAAAALGVAKDTASALFKAELDDAFFAPATQLKVLAFFNKDLVLATQLKQVIAPSDDEYKAIASYKGKWVYYRYDVQGGQTKGALIIEVRNGFWVGRHYNKAFEDHGFDEDRPDHEGFVFIIGGRLYIVGVGQHYFRPIVANVINSVKYDYLRGVVTLVDRNGSLLAASFVMLHETHGEFKKPKVDHYFELIGKSNKLVGVFLPNT